MPQGGRRVCTACSHVPRQVGRCDKSAPVRTLRLHMDSHVFHRRGGVKQKGSADKHAPTYKELVAYRSEGEVMARKKHAKKKNKQSEADVNTH